MTRVRAAAPEMQGQDGQKSINAMLAEVRAKRYAAVPRSPEDHVRSFAIPVLSSESGIALAAMVMVYYASSMTEREATGRFIEPMYEIAGQIASEIGDMRDSVSDPIVLLRRQ
jgi:DNA-binding IclR family transcriptional regulator